MCRIYEILAVLGAICTGISTVAVKKLQDTDSPFGIYFAMCATGFWLVIIPANLIPCEIGISGGIILLLVGITGTLGQIASTQAYKYLTVSSGSILELLTPIFNIPLGILVFNEQIYIQSIIGIILVLFSCIFLSIQNDNKRRDRYHDFKQNSLSFKKRR